MKAKLAKVTDIVTECRQTSDGDARTELERLIERFVEAALVIDPTIETVWVGRDGAGLDMPFMIHMVRRIA